MKDHEAITLRAFWVALADQTAPLAPAIQRQLNDLSSNLLANLVRLDEIAIAHPNLAAPYKDAIALLDSPSERSKGLLVAPDAQAERQNTENLVLDNIVQLRRSTLLENLLSLDDTTLAEKTTEILQSQDSVQAVADNLRPYLSSFPLGHDPHPQ